MRNGGSCIVCSWFGGVLSVGRTFAGDQGFKGTKKASISKKYLRKSIIKKSIIKKGVIKKYHESTQGLCLTWQAWKVSYAKSIRTFQRLNFFIYALNYFLITINQ